VNSPHPRGDNRTSLELYHRSTHEAAAVMLRRYSSSFSLGTRVLGQPQRSMIEDVYALVRLADEIVDTYRGADAKALLRALEKDVMATLKRGYSTNLVVNAFARTAVKVGIDKTQIRPFFASMEMDLARTEHDEKSFRTYVFGSAEVVGEMCLHVFLHGTGRTATPRAITGARTLGSAYQKVNFLRDLATDFEELGRSYFPGVTPDSLDEAQVRALADDCGRDLDAARECLDELPPRPRFAVRATIEIYGELLKKIRRTPASRLLTTRVRVTAGRKLWLTGKAALVTAGSR